MKRLIILIAALMLITTGCHKDKVEPRLNIISKQLSSGETYHFYDSGGPNGNYSDCEDYTYTFKAPSGKRVKIVFNDFYTEGGCDYLIINGTKYYGSNSPGIQYSSGSNFIVQWHSDGSVNYSGWSATVTVVN